MRIALATCRELPHLDADEAPLIGALKARGIDVIMPPWDAGDEPFVDPTTSLSVIRSTWDYTARVTEFVAWAQRIEEKTRGRLHNKASVVKWNTHKRYLTEVKSQGIAIVPTAIVPQGATCDLKMMLESYRWTKGAIVKPAVSAGSRDTVRVTGLDVDEAQATLTRMLPTVDMLVQPFLPTIADGELSLIYVDGTFTHAVNKRPRADDFRSQPEFGSHIERATPSAEWRAAADSIMKTVGGNLLYGRVDFVAGSKGEPLLMELELVEPSLYLRFDPDAAARLAEAIVTRAATSAL